MTSWPEVTLAQVSQKPQYGAIASADNKPVGPRFVRQTDIITGRVDWSGVPYAVLSPSDEEKYRLSPGDLLISRLGAGVGNAARMDDTPGAVFAGYLVRFKVLPSRADSRYVGYVLQSGPWRKHVQAVRSGGAQPTLNAKQMGAFRFALPPLEEQERIAGVLGAFDDLIETNRRLSGDLLARLFAEYEVLGRRQPSTTFGTVARLVRDQWKPGRKGPHRYLGLEHFATEGGGLIGHGSSSGVQSVSLRFARGDVLYGKLRPYFRKVARPGFDGLCSSEVWVLRAQEGYPQSLVHALAHSPRFSEVAMAGSGGTRMPRADWKQVSALPVPDLGSATMSQAELNGLEALWFAACELDDESKDLARQRDELLPLLMSGKVRVRDVEVATS